MYTTAVSKCRRRPSRRREEAAELLSDSRDVLGGNVLRSTPELGSSRQALPARTDNWVYFQSARAPPPVLQRLLARANRDNCSHVLCFSLVFDDSMSVNWVNCREHKISLGQFP